MRLTAVAVLPAARLLAVKLQSPLLELTQTRRPSQRTKVVWSSAISSTLHMRGWRQGGSRPPRAPPTSVSRAGPPPPGHTGGSLPQAAGCLPHQRSGWRTRRPRTQTHCEWSFLPGMRAAMRAAAELRPAGWQLLARPGAPPARLLDPPPHTHTHMCRGEEERTKYKRKCQDYR